MALERRGGFVAIRTAQARELARRLRERGVFVDARGDVVRMGPAPYLRDDQLTDAVAALGEVDSWRRVVSVPRTLTRAFYAGRRTDSGASAYRRYLPSVSRWSPARGRGTVARPWDLQHAELTSVPPHEKRRDEETRPAPFRFVDA
jgi:hypothetical protein